MNCGTITKLVWINSVGGSDWPLMRLGWGWVLWKGGCAGWVPITCMHFLWVIFGGKSSWKPKLHSKQSPTNTLPFENHSVKAKKWINMGANVWRIIFLVICLTRQISLHLPMFLEQLWQVLLQNSLRSCPGWAAVVSPQWLEVVMICSLEDQREQKIRKPLPSWLSFWDSWECFHLQAFNVEIPSFESNCPANYKSSSWPVSPEKLLMNVLSHTLLVCRTL